MGTTASELGSGLYYRFHRGVAVGANHLCVVVKISQGDAFVLTHRPVDPGLRRGITMLAEEHPIPCGFVRTGTHSASGGVSHVQ